MKTTVFATSLLLLCDSCQQNTPASTNLKDTASQTPIVKIKVLQTNPPPPSYTIEHGDTVYNFPDRAAQCPELKRFLKQELKNVKLGKGIVGVDVTITSLGFPINPRLSFSAVNDTNEPIKPTHIARQMDSIALDIAGRLPIFIPATIDSQLVASKENIIFRFE